MTHKPMTLKDVEQVRNEMKLVTVAADIIEHLTNSADDPRIINMNQSAVDVVRKLLAINGQLTDEVERLLKVT